MSGLARWIIIMGLALSAPAWAATAALLDDVRLTEVLKKSQPCCVIDARGEGLRKQQPIPFAVIYKEGIKPVPGGFAVVVGDNDQQALEIAQSISRKFGQDVYAVKGGYRTWRQVQEGGKKPSAAPEAATPQSFTIPSNTCEQGQALQEYK